MDINYQLHNQMSNNEEFAQMLSSVITYDDGYLSLLNGGACNMWDTSVNISHSNANMPPQDSQFMHRESLGTRIQDTPLNADANSSFPRVSYMPGNSGDNINIAASNCGIISCTVRDNNIPTQQQQTFPPCQISSRQGSDQLANPTYSRQMIIPAHHTSVTPFINYKNPRIEMTPEDPIVTYSHLQQSPKQVPMHFRSYDPVIGSALHQPNLVQNQQHNHAPLSVPSLQKHSTQFQPPNQMSEDAMKQLATAATVTGTICLRQLVYFMNHQQNRPEDNNIGFWRNFVEKYYSPTAKKRCCVSMTSMCKINHTKCWACDICGTNAGKGFEISYELLPRMSQFYFESCVENELLYLDSPIETQFPLGSMMLTFSNAIQQSIYKNFCVAHQGKLRIVFNKDLKISSWEFCVQSHEKFVSHDFLSTQANELVEIAKNIKRNREFNEAKGHQARNQVTNCNRLMAVGENLAENLELPNVNEAGFSKVFVRHMQMSDVFDSMKDLIGMCADNPSNTFSPIEAMKNLHKESKLKKQMESTSSHTPQTPSAGGNNILAASNIITYLKPSSSKQPMRSPLSNQHNLVTQDLRTTLGLYQTPNIRPSSYSSVPPYQPLYSASGGSSSHQQGPTVKHQINDLLARMHTDGITTTLSKGKGVNYSSAGSSSSYARTFADNCLKISESLSKDDTTSGFGHHRVEKK